MNKIKEGMLVQSMIFNTKERVSTKISQQKLGQRKRKNHGMKFNSAAGVNGDIFLSQLRFTSQ